MSRTRGESAAAPFRGIRRVAFIVAIASLVIAAVIGVVMILTGDADEVRWRIMGTTLVVGALGIVALADLTLVGRDVGWVGWLGVLFATIAAGLAIDSIWSGGDGPEFLFRVLSSTSIVAVALALTCLLLPLMSHRHRIVRRLLPVELGLIAATTLMLVLSAATDGEIPGAGGDWYWRMFWALLILAVLGAVVLPILGSMLRGQRPDASTALTVQLPIDLVDAIVARSASVGRSPTDYVIDTVRADLGESTVINADD